MLRTCTRYLPWHGSQFHWWWLPVPVVKSLHNGGRTVVGLAGSRSGKAQVSENSRRPKERWAIYYLFNLSLGQVAPISSGCGTGHDLAGRGTGVVLEDQRGGAGAMAGLAVQWARKRLE